MASWTGLGDGERGGDLVVFEVGRFDALGGHFKTRRLGDDIQHGFRI
ncbi:MAG: hypothetical protein JNJ83_06325 [Verrucomicrobiaceae bacterium]|nr:hypothetical protein [Verrucomicrobiaceae bacterium]